MTSEVSSTASAAEAAAMAPDQWSRLFSLDKKEAEDRELLRAQLQRWRAARGGVGQVAFYTADQDVIVRARLKGFVPNSAAATIESTGLSVPFTMILDTSVNLP